MNYCFYPAIPAKLKYLKRATFANTSKICFLPQKTLNSKSNHGFMPIPKDQGIFGIIIAHYHKTPGIFAYYMNRQQLTSSKPFTRSGASSSCPKEVYRIFS